MRPLQNGTLCPISASGSNFNPRNIPYIHPKGIYYAAPVVKIFAFLDLEQISEDFEIEYFETGSKYLDFLYHWIALTCPLSTDGDTLNYAF